MKVWISIMTLGLVLIACGSTNPEGTRSGDCSDGVDNDGDSRVDCMDDGCEAYPMCERMLHPKGSGLLSAQVKAAAEKSEKEE